MLAYEMFIPQKVVNLYKPSFLVITENQFVVQTHVIQQPNCTESARGSNNNSVRAEQTIFTFSVACQY